MAANPARVHAPPCGSTPPDKSRGRAYVRFMNKLIALAFFAFAAACTAPAPTPAQGALEVRGAWAAPSPGGVDVAAGYVTIVNGTGADDRLIAVSSPRAASVEVHEMSMDGDVMRMRAVEGGLPLPAGETVELAPGGLHLMFVGVTQAFTEGEGIPVTLTFASGGAIETTFPVQAGGAHGGH